MHFRIRYASNVHKPFKVINGFLENGLHVSQAEKLIY
jgi:hypothetical protein